MTQLQFQKATKAKARARVALYGPSGGGKTYSALAIASGMVKAGEKIAVIDTEHAAASKYSDRFTFDTLSMTQPSVEDVIAAIRTAEGAGYSVIIIDSLTHAWKKLLEELDATVKASNSSNSFAAWRVHTPRQAKLVDAILSSPCHIIATIRAKTEWVQETNDRGKMVPKRVGLEPVQGKDIEYEFDLLIGINSEHYATVEKDRSGKFQDQIIEKPGAEFGKALAAWLSEGVDAPPTPPPPPPAAATPKPAEKPTKIARTDDEVAAEDKLIAAIEAFTHIKRAEDEPAFRKAAGLILDAIGLGKHKIKTMTATQLDIALEELEKLVSSGRTWEEIHTPI